MSGTHSPLILDPADGNVVRSTPNDTITAGKLAPTGIGGVALDAGTQRITGLGYPTDAYDATPKAYVDAVVGSGAPTSSGAANLRSAIIDLGPMPMTEGSRIVTDADVTPSTPVAVFRSGRPVPGQDMDEATMDAMFLIAIPGDGQFAVFVRGLEGRIADKFEILYLLGGA